MVEAVIFDVDGTLVDSVDLHAEAWTVAFEKFGRVVSFDDVRRQNGEGSDQLLPVFFSQQELANFGAELDTYRGELFKKGLPAPRQSFSRGTRVIQKDHHEDKQIALASSAKADELKGPTKESLPTCLNTMMNRRSGKTRRSADNNNNLLPALLISHEAHFLCYR
ncbi:MAG: HAD hydrolase-like protein [Candidatus Binatia bacterium]